MRLQHTTWPEVEAYLGRSDGIVIPIGATEQHGPTGLIGTDAICAQTVGVALAERAGALVAPTIAVGMSQFHLGFPGSMTLRPTTLVAMIIDWVDALARHGFRHFYFVNGHGGNIAPVTIAAQEIYARQSLAVGGTGPDLRLRLKSWWDNPGVRAIVEAEFGAWEGYHVTPSEVAITRHVLPGLVSDRALPRPQLLNDLIDHGADGYYDSNDFRRRFPDGRVASDPNLGRADIGARIIEAAASDMVADYRTFLAEP